MTQLILFTDFASPLFEALLENPADILPTLQALKALNIPVIPITDKTRAEVLLLREQLHLTDPFITENGSGIFLPQDTPIPNPPGEPDGDYYVIELGCPYVQARAGLRVIANELQHSLLGFGDMSIDRLQKFASMTAEEAQHTKEREFSEPFITPKAVTPEQLVTAAQEIGFQIIPGEPFSYLIGPDAGKATAIHHLTQLYQTTVFASKTLVTLGISSIPQAADWFTAVDRSILLPHPTPASWTTALQSACQELGIKM